MSSWLATFDGFQLRDTYSTLTGLRRFHQILPANPPPPEPVVSSGSLIEDLELHQCRWPIGVGEDGRWRLCGHPRGIEPGAGQWYCADHAELALGGLAYFQPQRRAPEPRKQFEQKAEEFLAWRATREPVAEAWLEAA